MTRTTTLTSIGRPTRCSPHRIVERRWPRRGWVSRGWVAAASAVLLLGSALGSVQTGAPSAAADTLYGHDVSWPQCPSPGGYGLPMPPDTTSFVVLGVKKVGVPGSPGTTDDPFPANPCLAAELAWATSRSKPVSAYVVAVFPTDSQLAARGTLGPWSATTRSGRLANLGYDEATEAIKDMTAAGWTPLPKMVWIDVEPRSAQPWPTGTPKRIAENRLVIQGLMRGLDAARLTYGFYASASPWTDIVGTWKLPAVPVWATAGTRGSSAAAAMCDGPSFSAGRVYQAQWYDDTRDYDLTCPAYIASPGRAFPPSDGSDYNGDWKNDLMARHASLQDLRVYRGTATAGFLPPQVVGTGWGGFNLIDTPGDLDGNGTPDVIARDKSGQLWLYPRSANGWLPRTSLGSTWAGYSQIFGPGDFTGDGIPDVVAKATSTGRLYVFAGTGTGGLGAAQLIAIGWGSLSPILGAGDWDRNGVPDLLARYPATGQLFLYPRAADGTWLPRVSLGTGWNAMTSFAGIGDVNGDAVPDLVVRQSNGYLWLYPRSETGGLPRIGLGSGWNIYNLLM